MLLGLRVNRTFPAYQSVETEGTFSSCIAFRDISCQSFLSVCHFSNAVDAAEFAMFC